MNEKTNGHEKTKPAGWLSESTGAIPPLAFAIPKADFVRILQSFSKPDETRLRKIVEHQLLARYGSVVATLEAKRESSSPVVEYLLDLRKRLVDHVKRTAQITSDSKPSLQLPSGLTQVFLFGLIAAALLVGVFDWVTAAGFAARAETHDLTLALFFTGLIPFAPLVFKIQCHRIHTSGLSGGRLAGLCAMVILIGAFLWTFACTYAAPESPPPNLTDAIGNTSLLQGDKRPLFLMQMFAGIAAGAVLVNEISKRLVSTHHDTIAANWALADHELSKLDTRLAEARAKLAVPVGQLREWQASIEAQVADGIALIPLLLRKREVEQIYESHLAKSITQIDDQLTSWGVSRI